MDKDLSTGAIVFKCPVCGVTEPGCDEDTLMSSEVIESMSSSNEKHNTFIENSGHDKAGYKVMRK